MSIKNKSKSSLRKHKYLFLRPQFVRSHFLDGPPAANCSISRDLIDQSKHDSVTL